MSSCAILHTEATHQAAAVAEQLVDDDVIRSNPADPVEEREGLEDVAGEEVPASGSEERVEEEPFAAYTTTVTNSRVVL